MWFASSILYSEDGVLDRPSSMQATAVPEYTDHQKEVGLVSVALMLALLRLKNDPDALLDIHKELEILAEYPEPDRWRKIRLVVSFLQDEDWQALRQHEPTLEAMLHDRAEMSYAEIEAIAFRFLPEHQEALALSLLRSLSVDSRDITTKKGRKYQASGWVYQKRRMLCWYEYRDGKPYKRARSLINDSEVAFVLGLQKERLPVTDILEELELLRRSPTGNPEKNSGGDRGRTRKTGGSAHRKA